MKKYLVEDHKDILLHYDIPLILHYAESEDDEESNSASKLTIKANEDQIKKRYGTRLFIQMNRFYKPISRTYKDPNYNGQ